MATQIRKPYNRTRVQTSFTGDSLTKQQFKKECDINHILKRYKKTGIIDHVKQSSISYLDLTDVPTFHEALNIVHSANDAFMSLPSVLRNKFKNDPSLFLDFVSDPKNESEMRELGLLEPVRPVAVDSPPPADDPEPPVGDPDPA